MFSFKKGLIPCIKIKGGRLNDKIISVCPESFSRKKDKDEEKNFVKINEDDNNVPKKLYKNIVVDDGNLQLIPGYKERDLVYVTGPSGCGKSTFCSMWVEQWKLLHPNGNIILISPISDDKVINRLNPLRLKLSEKNFVDPTTKITLEEVAGSCIIFDDIDAISDKNIKKGIEDFRKQILITGRHYNISSCSTTHKATNYNETRDLLNESHFVTFFRGGTNNHIIRFMKNYLGLSRKMIRHILNSKSRTITIHTKYPQFVLLKDYCYILDDDEDADCSDNEVVEEVYDQSVDSDSD